MAITAASLMVKVGADTTPAERALSSFSRSLGSTLDNGVRQANNFSGQFNRAISGITAGFAGGMGFGAVTVGLNSAIGAIQGVIGDAATAYMETERLTMSLKAMSAQELVNAGSARNFTEGLAMAGERANELLGWIQDLAIESPFGSQDIASVMRMGMVYGFNSEQAKRSTKAISDYGAALGLTGPEMERVIRALGQMNQRGKVTSQELMQLSEVGVGGLQILADAAGVSTAEMQKMVEQGLVPAGPAIEAITAKMETYNGAAAANAGTLGGLVASMDDLKTIGTVELFGPAFQAMQPALTELVDGMKSQEFRDGLNAIGTQLGVFAGEGVAAGAEAIKSAVALFTQASTLETPQWLSLVAGLAGINVEVTPTLPPGYPGLKVPATAEATPNLPPGYQGLTVPATSEVTPNLPPQFQPLNVPSKISAVYLDKERDYGVVVDSTAQVTTIDLQGREDKDGFALTINSKAKVTTLEMEVPGREPGSDDTWKINFVADWKEGTLVKLLGNAGLGTAMAFQATASWVAGTGSGLMASLQSTFNEPVMVSGSWITGTLETLWGTVSDFFSQNPIAVALGLDDKTPEVGAEHSGHGNFPRHPTPVPDSSDNFWPYDDYPQGARGFRNFKGGLALVGEEGPELVVLPPGADVIPNDKTMRMIPGFAEGTPGALPPGATFGGLSSSFGNAGDLAVQGAAKAIKDAAKDMTKAMRQAIGDLEDAIRSTPGLMGTSKVTSDQMRMAGMGVPQSFADDYLRRLSDEVINGVDWANVDIKEAAAAAGIDPNLPAQAILEMFRAAWSDSSLFANPENLKFINTDAVRAQMERQQASEEGKNNIMALFGVGDEELVNQIAGLGIQISSGLQEYLGEQGMGPVGAQAAAGIGTGIAENGGPMGTGLVSGFTNWMTSPDGLSAMASMGDALVANLNAAYKKATPGYDWSVPAGGEPASTPGATPALARGTSWFRGGLALVGEEGPELVRLPMGASVLDAGATAALAPVTVVINATVSQPHDVDLLARKVARVIQQKRGR